MADEETDVVIDETGARERAGEILPDSYNRALPFRFDRLTRGMNAIGTIGIFGLMVLMTADVIGRGLFNAPIRGVIEVVTLSIVGIVFLQLADALRSGRFTRADVVLTRLARSRPRASRLLQAAFHFAGAFLLTVLAYASWPLFVESWTNVEYLGAIGDFQARVWPMRLIIVLGSACTALTFAFLAYSDLRAAFEESRR